MCGGREWFGEEGAFLPSPFCERGLDFRKSLGGLLAQL